MIPAVLVDPLVPASVSWPVPWPGTVVVVRGGTARARHDVAAALLARLAADEGPAEVVTPARASTWPFTFPLVYERRAPATPGLVWMPDLHEAFVNRQTNATRLVTTQPLYLLPHWLAAIDADPGLRLLATIDVDVMRAHGEEALDGRGAWRRVTWVDAPDLESDARPVQPAPHDATPVTKLAAAFRADDAAGRLAAVGRVLDEVRTPAHLVAMASVCMEVNDLDNAGHLLRAAVEAAPDWAAAHFEHGKWCVRRDDMAGAAAAFGTAARLLPAFVSAAANWGATLGELDRTEEAHAAFSLALTHDPDNPQALNNVGVVSRELGRLADSEAAFRKVIARTPDLAFGHYNLGHTLFLQGRYQASLAAYQAGQRRDPDRNPVQASRLALAKLATGDAAGALVDLKGCTTNLPRDYRRQLLSDTQSVAWALLSASPDVVDWRIVGDWLTAELSRA